MKVKFIIPLPKIPKRIFVLDSSFNPPTKAHLTMLETTPHTPNDGHLLLLSTRNVDKSQNNFEDRVELLKSIGLPLAVTDSARFVDKAAEFDVETCFIMGFDTVVRFLDPKYYQNFDTEIAQFFSKSSIWLVDRGDLKQPIWERPEMHRGLKFKDRIFVNDRLEQYAEVSSTQVRKLLQEYYENQNIESRSNLQKIVCSPVLEIILKKQLYQENL